MPIGFGSPAARVSTLIVDGSLDMGVNHIQCNEIAPSGASDKVTVIGDLAVNEIVERFTGSGVEIDSLHTDLIDDTIVGKGTKFEELATYAYGIMFLSSGTTRGSDISEETNTGGGYTLIKSLTIPSNYMDGGSVNASWQARRAGSGASHTRIYVNGVAYGREHATYSATYETFYQVVTGLKSGDTVELWCDSHYAANVVYMRNYTLGADDHMMIKQMHEDW